MKHDELIEEIERLINCNWVGDKTDASLRASLEALKADSFDVLEHLRGGGKAVSNTADCVIFVNGGTLLAEKPGGRRWNGSLKDNLVLWDDWQPYEAPLEGAKQMNKAEQEIIAGLEEALDHAKKELEIARKQAETKPWPQVGDEYWLLGTDGFTATTGWVGNGNEPKWLAQGNIFKTKALAEREGARRIVTQKLKMLVPSDWVPDWKDRQQKKWCILFDEYSIDDLKWTTAYDVTYRCQGTIYFPTEAIAQQALNLGDELDVLRS